MEVKINESDEIFEIESTKVSPHVFFDKKYMRLKLEGVSIIEDSDAFYGLLKEQLEHFFGQKPQIRRRFIVEIYFIYINTMAIKNVVMILDYIRRAGIPMQIYWYYSDEDIYESGKQISELISVPFVLVHKEIEGNVNYFEQEN